MSKQPGSTRPDLDDSDRAAARELLGGTGPRITVARAVVLRVLRQANGHLSAAEVHRRVIALAPSVNLSTVYRTLSWLQEIGVTHCLATEGESLFGLSAHDHHHAWCAACGSILELTTNDLKRALRAAELASGFRIVSSAGLTIRGVCARCAH